LNASIAGALFVIALVAGIVSGVIFMVVMAAAGAVCDVLGRLPKNGYGLCSGSNGPNASETDDPPLTDWLHRFFQEVANRPLDRPVTFGDLWGTDKDTEERDIELVLMTTNITRGISQRLPFLEGSWGQLFFDRKEFEALFPAAVVDHMWKKRAPVRHEEDLDMPEDFGALPAPADLPILLGARMSLSFPFLLSAVPLYAANVTERRGDGKIPLQRCWFSDGGLTSNFPINSSISMRRCRRGPPSASTSSRKVSLSAMRLRPAPTRARLPVCGRVERPSERPLPSGTKSICRARTLQASVRRRGSTASARSAASSAPCSTRRGTGPIPS
jgi:hypothetical protein